MPELPEVETVVLGLKSSITNQKIISATTSSKSMRQNPAPDFLKRIQNRTITNISRRAKYILISLDNSEIIVFHLGMSGRLFFSDKFPTNPHNHCIFKLSSEQFLIFYDPRRFGFYGIFSPKELKTAKSFANLGAEPLCKEFNITYLKKHCNITKRRIKQVIMDNKIVVGIGNIYASESLFLAKISPTRAANTLTDQELAILISSISSILKKAINFGGSTLKDYRTSDGSTGNFQNHFMIYGKEGKMCSSCHKNKIQKSIICGRSTYFCNHCQH